MMRAWQGVAYSIRKLMPWSWYGPSFIAILPLPSLQPCLMVQKGDQKGLFFRLEKCLGFKHVGNPINQSNTIDALLHIFNSTKQIMHTVISFVWILLGLNLNVIPWHCCTVDQSPFNQMLTAWQGVAYSIRKLMPRAWYGPSFIAILPLPSLQPCLRVRNRDQEGHFSGWKNVWASNMWVISSIKAAPLML